MLVSPPSPAAGFGLGLGDGAGLGTAGVLRPVGIGGRTGLTSDPGRLSEEGDVAAASWSEQVASGVWPGVRWSEIKILYLIQAQLYNQIFIMYYITLKLHVI